MPAASPVDTDGDLLLDELELLLFGDLTQDGSGDFDLDGIGNLQEFLDATDATDSLSHSGLARNTSPPQIQLELALGGQLKLSWYWPEAYASKVKFQVLTAEKLGEQFTEVAMAAVHLGGGYFEAVLSSGNTEAQFYRLRLSL